MQHTVTSTTQIPGPIRSLESAENLNLDKILPLEGPT